MTTVIESDMQTDQLHLPFHPHWDSGGYLRHWNVTHCGGHHHPRVAGPAGGFVGRLGMLAVVFGIGTAVASGCIACASANADTGEGNPSQGGATTSTSQSVRAGHPAAVSGQSGQSVRRPAAAQAPAAQSPDAQDPGAGSRRVATRLGDGPQGAARPSDASGRSAASAATRITVPDVAAPEVRPAGQPAAPLVSRDQFAAVGEQPLGATIALQIPMAVPATTVSVPAPAVVIASPPAASVTIEPTFSSVLAALSDAMMDTTAVPADTALALLLGAVRREERSVAGSASAVRAAAAATSVVTPSAEAEQMTVSGAGRSVADRNASGGYAIALTGIGQASTTMTLPEAVGVTLRLRTGAGAPNMTLSIDGVPYTTLLVTSTSYSDYIFAGGISAGTHVISISSTTATTRNVLYVDKVTTSSGAIVDEFAGNSGSAPSRLWTARSGTGFDSGKQTYSSSNAFLDGQGHLVIQATKGKKGSYTSGWVWTKNNLSFGYGTITARVKMPKGQGLWPAVWLMGADSDTAGWPASGEIDIAELPSTTTTVYSTLHGPISGSADTQQAQIISTLPDLSTDYHNYWVRHMPDEITFGVDAQTLGTLTPADLSAGETWVYNRPTYMILNLAVGGSWAGAPDGTTSFPAKMLVESVTFAPS